MNDPENRKYSINRQMSAAFLLWSLLLAIVPGFAAEKRGAPDGMVFCPLSKKLQLTKAPKAEKKPEPFEHLCASSKNKEFLFNELILKNPLKTFSLDSKDFENLVFDVLTRGKAAFEKLPFAPHPPRENIIAQTTSTAAAGSRHEPKSVRTTSILTFTEPLLARPPTAPQSRVFPKKLPYRSAVLSRRSAPRAPPLFS